MSNNKTTTESFTLTVTDDNGAAGAGDGGLFLCFTGSDRPYLAANNAGAVGSELAVTATDANGNTLTDYLYVTHNADPGSNLDGVQVYCDDDATGDSILMVVSPQNMDHHVYTMKYGAAFKIDDQDTAATLGVAIYFDDDNATATARLRCVNANNASVTLASDQNVSGHYVASHLNDL